jgi:hypothetical protein
LHHLLGFFLLLRISKKLSSLNIVELVEYFPESIKTLQNIPLAVSFVYKNILTDENKLRDEQKRLGEDLNSLDILKVATLTICFQRCHWNALHAIKQIVQLRRALTYVQELMNIL